MKVITQTIAGRLESWDGDAATRIAVWLFKSDASAPNSGALISFSFAFVTLGPEEHVLPESLLDDWGNEVTSLKLYHWVREYGDQFPRAELFGYDPAGARRQHFLRELELHAPFPCYALPTTAGPWPTVQPALVQRVTDFLIATPARHALRRTDVPADIGYPLRAAAVRWWEVPPGLHDLASLVLVEQS